MLYFTNSGHRNFRSCLFVGSMISLTGCASIDGAMDATKDFVMENKGVVTGAVIGSVAASGACVMNGSDNVAKCAVGGAIIGGIAGYLWDQREKSLREAAESHNLDLETERFKTRNERYLADTDQSASLQQAENAMSTVVRDKEMFATGSSRLNPASREALLAVAKSYVEDNKKILIIGHTDSSGDASLNQRLSEQRARAVAKLFVDAGIPKSDIYFQGVGESRPVVSNTTAADRMKNRRVEIVEADSEASLVAFDIAESRSKEHLAFANKPRSTAKSVHHQQRVDFGGQPVGGMDMAMYNKVLATAKPGISFSFFSKAYADTPVINQPVACYQDAPRIAGQIRKAKGGGAVDQSRYAIREHVPGLAGIAIHARVNGHNVGLGPVSVLKKSFAVPEAPTLFLYKNYKGSHAKADLAYKTIVNTYEGEDNFLYRIFVVDKNPAVQCIDLVYPKGGARQSVDGILFYQADGVYAASYRPLKI